MTRPLGAVFSFFVVASSSTDPSTPFQLVRPQISHNFLSIESVAVELVDFSQQKTIQHKPLQERVAMTNACSTAQDRKFFEPNLLKLPSDRHILSAHTLKIVLSPDGLASLFRFASQFHASMSSSPSSARGAMNPGCTRYESMVHQL